MTARLRGSGGGGDDVGADAFLDFVSAFGFSGNINVRSGHDV